VDQLDEIRLIVEELHDNLDALPYHVFLGVVPTATGDQLRAGYHERAQVFHPDRFHSAEDQALRDKVYTVFKRMTEAYAVLSNPQKRAAYEAQREAGAVRLGPIDRTAAQRKPEDELRDPRARKFYGLGMAAVARGDRQGALLSLRMALALVPDSTLVQRALADLTP
jgi:curved DNA-binding protein CbpA